MKGLLLQGYPKVITVVTFNYYQSKTYFQEPKFTKVTKFQEDLYPMMRTCIEIENK